MPPTLQDENLKQEIGSKNCVAVVAAMAFSSTVLEFEQFAKRSEEGSFKDSDLIKFGISKGYYVGAGFDFPFANGVNNKIVAVHDINNSPAYLIVESESNPDKTHALYWDGQKIFDPNPLVNDGRPIKEYNVLGWYPIHKIF